MGLISLLITLVIMVAGASYYFFGMPWSSVTMTNNQTAPVIEQAAGYEALKEQVIDLKEEIEQKTEEVVQEMQGIAVGEPDPNSKIPPVSEEPDNIKIVDRFMSSGFSVPSKARTIDTIVLHSSYDALGSDPYSVSGLVKEYEEYGVSAHYLIDRKGIIYRLVADKNIAYHAGVSKMPDGRTNVNDFSIGIEIMNQKEASYTDAQYSAVNQLVASLKGKYPIKNVVGHDDIAPDRKTDPWNFDWKKLAK